MPEPDLAVVKRELRDYRDAHPSNALLVVEIADTTLDYDRRRKAALYTSAGIDEYWIVNLGDRCVEVYRSPSEAGYRSVQAYHAGDAVAPVAKLGPPVTVSEILP